MSDFDRRPAILLQDASTNPAEKAPAARMVRRLADRHGTPEKAGEVLAMLGLDDQ